MALEQIIFLLVVFGLLELVAIIMLSGRLLDMRDDVVTLREELRAIDERRRGSYARDAAQTVLNRPRGQLAE